MNDNPPTAPNPARPQPAWTRDHVLGCLLLGVKQIEAEGHVRMAAEMRHLAMLWYTGARRASPARNRVEDADAASLPFKVRRRAKQPEPAPEPAQTESA
jgi:hypothetical protein